MIRFVLLLTILLATRAVSVAQSEPALERLVSISGKQTVQQVLTSVQQQTNVVFSFNTNLIETDQQVSIAANKQTVRQVLFLLFKNRITYTVRGNYIILQKKVIPVATQTAKPAKRTLEGYVSNPSTGAHVANASVYADNYQSYTVTDEFGYFKLDIPSDQPLEPIHVRKLGFCDTVLPAVALDSALVDAHLHSDCPVPRNTNVEPSYIAYFSRILPKDKRAFLQNVTDTVFTKVQISLLPFVGTNALLSGNSNNKISLNATVGYVQDVDGVEVGTILNIVKNNVIGVDAAGIGSIIGNDCHGVQAAGVFTVAQTVSGAQGAGILCIADSVNGAQGAGYVAYSRSLVGVQGSSMICASKQLQGVSASGLLCGSLNLKGVALGGFANGIKKLEGVSLAGGVSITQEARGVSIAGAVTIADTMHGFQMAALVNKARVLEGVQVGLINIADTCTGAQIGLINWVRRGYHYFEFSADETFYTNFAFRSGTKLFHTILTAGMKPQSINPFVWTFGYGFGTTLGNGKRLRYDFDFIANQVIGNESLDGNTLLRAYAGFDIRLSEKRSIALGADYNFYIAQTDLNIAPKYAQAATTSNNAGHQQWIGAKLAYRWF